MKFYLAGEHRSKWVRELGSKVLLSFSSFSMQLGAPKICTNAFHAAFELCFLQHPIQSKSPLTR
jgi:hypothetical protein